MSIECQTRGAPQRASAPSAKQISRYTSLALLGLTMAAGQAYGQATDDSGTDGPIDSEVYVLEAFTVTGIQESLTQAVEIKREEYQMVDAIVAEDIGKFPDNNLVEALQRVSGVQTTDRGSGEVSTVTIRGLSDVTTTINGRSIFTSSGRSVALADIPASLLAGVNVYKTRSADQLETGIAGVIDIKTQRPFNFDGSKTVVSLRTIYSDQPEKWDPNVSALTSKTWDTRYGKFGALVNVSYAETHYEDMWMCSGALVPFMTDNPIDGWGAYERIFATDARAPDQILWEAGSVNGLPIKPGSTLDIGGQQAEYVLSRDAINIQDFTGLRKRAAANVSLQWAPNDNSEYTFEVFYNGYRNDSFNSMFFAYADAWWANGDNPYLVTYDDTNVVAERTVGDTATFTSGDYSEAQTDSILYGLTGKWDIGENLKVTSDLTYQYSQWSSDFLAMRLNGRLSEATFDFNNAGSGELAMSTPDDITDLGMWTIGEVYDNSDKSKGDAITWTADADYYLPWRFFRTISAGVRVDSRTASEFSRRDSTGATNHSAADYAQWMGVTDDFWTDAGVPHAWAIADGKSIYGHREDVRNLVGLPAESEHVLDKDFDVSEDTYSGYAQTDFRTTLLGRTFSGQAGVRYTDVETDITFDGEGADKSTEKFLPDVILRYELADNLMLRASYGQTLRRPNFGDLNPVITYTDDLTETGIGNASGGNPDLDPVESKNYDLSLEYYFGRGNAIYAQLFQRDIDGLIINFRRRVEHLSDLSGEMEDYILTQPYNASNGKLKGVELGLVYFPERIPEWLQGIGTQISCTILDSSQDTPLVNDQGEVYGYKTNDMPGVSDVSYSVVLAYEKERFSSRLGFVWRDDFYSGDEGTNFANPLAIYRKAEMSLDLQISYNLTDSLVLTFDGTNLLDGNTEQYYGDYANYMNFSAQTYSRTYAVGLRYEF